MELQFRTLAVFLRSRIENVFLRYQPDVLRRPVSVPVSVSVPETEPVREVKVFGCVGLPSLGP